MYIIICFCLVLTSIHGHTNKVQTEAEMQSALMPQELNPAFVSEKNGPLSSFLPLPRLRREADLVDVSLEQATSASIGQQIKYWSRILACIVLVISAVSEIVLYFIEIYYSSHI